MPNLTDRPQSVIALFWNERREILVASRKTNHSDLGFPGGKVDPGESTEEAIVREVLEETGIQIIRMEHVFEQPCGIYLAHTFLVHEWQGEPKSLEGALVTWVQPLRLLDPACSFQEYNRALFKHLWMV
jgi:8-oxo-dGTP diphosphatase